MRRICKSCGKVLSTVCDHCGSLNVRESHTVPKTYNCGNCHRRSVPIKDEQGECHECGMRGKGSK